METYIIKPNWITHCVGDNDDPWRLAEPEQEELRRSFLIWLRTGFLQARLPNTPLPELNNLEEARIMLSERVVDWTKQWKQQGLEQGLEQGLREGERRMLLRQIRRQFSEAVAMQSASNLKQIDDLSVFEKLSDELFECADETAWLARLRIAANGQDRH